MPRKVQPAGAEGEKLAADFLKRNGFKILERNYSCPAGELDLIALDGDEVVFIEVKSARQSEFGPPGVRVDSAKQRRLSLIALHYFQRKKLQQVNCRFDVVSVFIPREHEPAIEHYRDAFPLRLTF